MTTQPLSALTMLLSRHTRRSGQQRRQPVLASIAIRPSFLIGELRLGKLSETVVVVGDAPHDRPGFLMCHLVGNCASFLSSKAPMLRVPSKLSDHQLTSTSVPWPKSSAAAKRKARAFLDPRLLSWDGTRERCLRPRVELGGQSVRPVGGTFLESEVMQL